VSQPQAVPARLEPPGAAKGVGVIAPFDFMLDRELWELVPAGVTLYVTRTPYVDLAVSVELAEELSDEDVIGAAARDLSVAWPAATVYLCTSASFVDGVVGEERLRAVMEAHGAVRAVTTSGAAAAAPPPRGPRGAAGARPRRRAPTRLRRGRGHG
jgi:maleate isomerase